MRAKHGGSKHVLNGYLLLTTSGILLFILTAVTTLQLLSGKTLTKEYRLISAYQDVLNRNSIEDIILMHISKNEPLIALPTEFNGYQISSINEHDGSVTFYTSHIDTDKVTTFNVTNTQNHADLTSINLTAIGTSVNEISNIQVSSTVTTNLVSIRSVWFPSFPDEAILSYEFYHQDAWQTITANALESTVFTLPVPIESKNLMMTILFENSLVDRIFSVYLTYSDESVKDITIEI